MSKRKPPKIRARSAGTVSMQTDSLAALYLENNPGKAVRFVYAPEHLNAGMSLLKRTAQGYVAAKGVDLGEGSPFAADAPVRIGDLILMGVDEEVKATIAAGIQRDIKEERKRVEESFRDEMANAGAPGSDGRIHRSNVVGSALIEEKEHSYDVQQEKE